MLKENSSLISLSKIYVILVFFLLITFYILHTDCNKASPAEYENFEHLLKNITSTKAQI